MEWSHGVESWCGILELSFGVEWSQSLSLCCSYRFIKYKTYGRVSACWWNWWHFNVPFEKKVLLQPSTEIVSEYHNHKLQTTPWHREEERPNHHETPGRQIKQSNQLSLPHQDDCNTRMDIKYVQQNIEQLQTPTMGVTINKKSTTTEPPP